MIPDKRSERVLILAPIGRDGAIAASLLRERGIGAVSCSDITELLAKLTEGAGLVLVTQEALQAVDLRGLADWIARQPAWSDLPFIVMTQRGGGPERNPEARRLIKNLGNVTLIERPFHPFTLVSVAETALRSRRRQYQSQAQLHDLAQQQKAVEESEDRFRMLADNIPVLAWTANADGWIFWYNSRWYDYTGTSPEQMEGWGWQSVHDPDVLPLVMDKWQKAIACRESFEMVFPLRRADGVWRPFLTRVAPVHDEVGDVIRWFGTNVDISAEREAEATVRASEERLRFALTAAHLGSWDLDYDADVMRCSDICKANFGRMPDMRFTYDDLLASVHPDDKHLMQAAVVKSLTSEAEYAVDYRVLWPDQSLHWVEIRGRAIREPGQPTRLAGVSLEITERKHIEAELQTHRTKLEELVGERTRELEAAMDRLKSEIVERERTEEALRQSQKMEAIGQLTGGIAHDFNNLLTGISGCLELMQTRLNQGRTGELARYIVAGLESVNRAAGLTHRLLSFARRQTLEHKPVNINKLASGMEDLIRRTTGPSIEVELVLAGAVWMTLCDGNQLESALLNLCINAWDAMPDGGRLTIETANTRLDEAYVSTQRDLKAGQYVMLSVTDTGIGMSPETVAHAFDPFFTTKPIGEGTGLGLSMVYGFVKQSEGHIRIYSEEGIGTSVHIYLPRNLQIDDQIDDWRDAAEAFPISQTGKAVLVVDDESIIRSLIVEALLENGYQAIEAADGPSGLRIIQDGAAVELLLTDVGLPGMNGRQLADAAREVRPNLKVLFITGYAHNAAIGNRLLEANMHLVTKPFALDVLSAKVREMIDGEA